MTDYETRFIMEIQNEGIVTGFRICLSLSLTISLALAR